MSKDTRRQRIGLLGCGPFLHAVHLDVFPRTRHIDADFNRVLTDRPLSADVDEYDVTGPTLSSEDGGAVSPASPKKSYRWPFCLLDQ
jgi:hypothetical protein